MNPKLLQSAQTDYFSLREVTDASYNTGQGIQECLHFKVDKLRDGKIVFTASGSVSFNLPFSKELVTISSELERVYPFLAKELKTYFKSLYDKSTKTT